MTAANDQMPEPPTCPLPRGHDPRGPPSTTCRGRPRDQRSAPPRAARPRPGRPVALELIGELNGELGASQSPRAGRQPLLAPDRPTSSSWPGRATRPSAAGRSGSSSPAWPRSSACTCARRSPPGRHIGGMILRALETTAPAWAVTASCSRRAPARSRPWPPLPAPRLRRDPCWGEYLDSVATSTCPAARTSADPPVDSRYQQGQPCHCRVLARRVPVFHRIHRRLGIPTGCGQPRETHTDVTSAPPGVDGAETHAPRRRPGASDLRQMGIRSGRVSVGSGSVPGRSAPTGAGASVVLRGGDDAPRMSPRPPSRYQLLVPPGTRPRVVAEDHHHAEAQQVNMRIGTQRGLILYPGVARHRRRVAARGRGWVRDEVALGLPPDFDFAAGTWRAHRPWRGRDSEPPPDEPAGTFALGGLGHGGSLTGAGIDDGAGGGPCYPCGPWERGCWSSTTTTRSSTTSSSTWARPAPSPWSTATTTSPSTTPTPSSRDGAHQPRSRPPGGRRPVQRGDPPLLPAGGPCSGVPRAPVHRPDLRRRRRAGPEIMHGKTSAIFHTTAPACSPASQPLEATRYHSLVVDRDSVPDCLEITRRPATASSWACATGSSTSRACSSTPSRSSPTGPRADRQLPRSGLRPRPTSTDAVPPPRPRCRSVTGR